MNNVAPTTERTVLIQGKPVVVVPQRHARLRRKLSGEDFARIMTADYGHEAYRVLGVLIPQLHKVIPEHEWEGFASKEDWEHWRNTGEDTRPDEQADKEDELSPTTDEIVLLFDTAFKVSGAQRLGKLFDLAQMAGMNANSGPQLNENASPTPVSPGLPGGNGESA